MTRLRQCSTEVIGRIKKMFTCLIKEAFRYRFKFQCPKYLCRVRDLTFLPHLLQYQMSWHEVTLTQLSHELNISPNDLDLALTQPGLLQPEEGTHPVGERLLNYRLDNKGALPTRMKSFHSWNLSSWVSTATQDYRLRRCKRLLRSGPICIQETKWKGPETEALYQNLPGVQIVHTSAVAFNERTCTGGVAILFPPGWQVLEEVILVKGRCVAALVQDRTCKFYVISVYIHPDNRNGDMEALLRAWRFLEKKSEYTFLAGDFNGIDKHNPQLWDKFLLQFQCSDVYPDLATFRHARGVSCLDRGLVPDSLTNSSKLYASASALTSHVANGHDIVKIKINVKPNVLNNPRHLKHEVIPSGVFMPGKDGTPVSSTSELQSLVRLLHREHCRLFTDWQGNDAWNETLSHPPPVTGRCSPLGQDGDSVATCTARPPPSSGRGSPHDIAVTSAPSCPGPSFPAYLGSYLSIVGCFWAWWRTQPPPHLHPNIRPYCRARKYLSSGAQWINVPKEVVEDLVVASKHSVLSSTETLPTINGCFSMPRTLVQSLVEVIDACVEGIPYVPLDEANMQARGLGTMVAFWERMRHICPKVNIYHGPIYGKDGAQCVTSNDLDEAMLATRDFWFQTPAEYDEDWQPILDCYAEGEPWKPFCPPDEGMFLNTLLHTKDSAPGPDGLPYSAWRLLPKVTVEAMKSCFLDIINGTALPPHQVGVWIPKAKIGPEADCFRPLGMPNTLERLVDGSVAAQAMRQTAHTMHPSQAVMSCFKEPQKAVSCIQKILDGDTAAMALLADLSKAFERVNPYWILELLRIRRAPRWLYAYAKFVLFHRRVSHKVQGRLLPSRTIRQGVDMGRSFSVYLFCLAIDPLFTYLNRIPGVISVQGYIDDTTIVGNSHSLSWLEEVTYTYECLRSAGFVVDAHSCFRACITIQNRKRPSTMNSDEIENVWTGLISSEPYPTALAALKAHSKPGYNTVIVRIGSKAAVPGEQNPMAPRSCMACVLTYQQVQDISAGREVHQLGAFAKVKCECKSKSNIIVNAPLSVRSLHKVETSSFGVQAICPIAPSLGLALLGRWELDDHGVFVPVEPPQGLNDVNTGPFRKLCDRLKSFYRPTLSITARCTGFNTFILSVMPYTISYFGLTTADLNRLRQASARFILKRHWLEAEILPHVLRYFGIATLLDPAVSATIAATGLYLREGNPVEELDYQNGREECGNPRQKSVVLALMDLWSPYVGLEELVGAVATTHGPIPKKLSALKKVILNRMELEAKSRIIKKIRKEGWSGGISPEWVVLVAGAPKKLCNGTGRYTLLRWAVNQDDDVWLSMRGTRHQQKCGTCGLPGESFPHGYYQPPLCESCIRAVKLDAWALAPWSKSLRDAYTAEDCQSQLANWTQEWNVQPAHVVVCRACGCGDNTIGHWTRWCVVPLMVAIAILQPNEKEKTLDQLASGGSREAIVCTLVLASFRRLLRQEGAFLHQQAAAAKPVQWWVLTLHENVAKDAHIQLQVDFPRCKGTSGRCTLDDTQVGVQRILPLNYSTMHLPPIVGVCQEKVEAGDRLAVLPLNSPVVAAIREMEGLVVPMQGNVKTNIVMCQCGSLHASLHSSADLCPGDILVPSNACEPRIMVQFDGSSHRTRGVGGAGAALLQVECSGLALLDWEAQALPVCADNIVAETHGAGLALSLYEKYRQLSQQQSITPLPLDRIQGDIKPLLQHLDFRGRFRRQDLINLIHRFHTKRSRIAPNSITEYRPREANTLADYFAGQASAWLLQKGNLQNPTVEPIAVQADPPYDLLLAANAVLLGPHKTGKIVLILREKPGCSLTQLGRFAGWDEGKCAAQVKAIALATKKGSQMMSVEYVTPASDGRGRLYARQIGAQSLPRQLRLLIYGETHKEVDITGAHYELTRSLCNSQSLPPISALREKLRHLWASRLSSDVEGEVGRAIKLFPIRVINSGAVAALNHLHLLCLNTPPWVSAFAFDLDAARKVTTEHLLQSLRPGLDVAFRNRSFFAMEAIESIVMQLFLLEVRKRCFAPSIIWLHDGFWIDKQVDNEVLFAAEKHVKTLLFPTYNVHSPLFHVTDLTEVRNQALASCLPLPCVPLISCPSDIAIAELGTQKYTREFPVAKFFHKRGYKRQMSGYFIRIGKRARHSWLR